MKYQHDPRQQERGNGNDLKKKIEMLIKWKICTDDRSIWCVKCVEEVFALVREVAKRKFLWVEEMQGRFYQFGTIGGLTPVVFAICEF